MKASELKGEAKQLFEEWRQLGYTESQALDRVQRSGLLREPELYEAFRSIFGLSEGAASTAALGRNPEPADDRGRVVENLKSSFGLSDRQAQIAADGRDGPSRRASSTPVSEAELAKLRPDPANIKDVIRKIEEVASDLCRRGVPEEKALRESAFELMRILPSDQLADWVARIAAFRWPWIYSDPGSSGGSKTTQTRSVGETTRQPGRRTVSE